MTGQLRALLRLLAVQGAWSYERMLGVGLGYAATPLLEDLKSADPSRYSEAVIRSAEYFNSHPYIAGLALGATVRAEYDAVPGAQITRLRTALCGPLGSLGDQLFWAGVLPALIGLAVVVAALGYPLFAVVGFLVLFNGIRLATSVWALRTGLASGIRVGAGIGASWLPWAAERAGLIAGAGVGVALAVVSGWLLEPFQLSEMLLALGVLLGGLVGSWRFGARLPALRFALIILSLALAWAWEVA
jgi:mannose/fructose/N-acetylgalactosamine-specific phosphotransferase system component IID